MTDPTADTGSEPETETEETPEPFANRAARRAKGKASAQAVGAGGPRQLQSGNVQSPRQYGNRRSG
ncbi:hypothetical protein [Actinoplanes derwentensis]|uniref:Uncharacterized protein n=1 Tax=Actinoplanes derwentensis TaxID=113562 RepID=A0A1H2CWT1_9ACTN|nr:hypothetical protein [Actinoplanes derwentensis]GID87884.1 hypothetical protein Ade03nite_68080 [Actinoplanes derwentensis]SDT74911.1 hypothetical protein SAMN04489716_7134 [Actinoplanes derwentensis]